MLDENDATLDDMSSQSEARLDSQSAEKSETRRRSAIQDVVDSLDVPAAIVEIIPPDLTPNVTTLVFRSGGKQPSVLRSPGLENQIGNLLQTYYREVVQYSRHGDIGQRWQNLAAPLLSEWLPSLQGVELVYLIPHGNLCFLPLHAVRIDGDYLMDRFAIAYAPSSAILKQVIERDAGRTYRGVPRAIVVGNPTLDLEHTEKEAVEVAEFFGAKPYLGGKATRVKIRAELEGKDVIHLACHGFFHSSEPWLSSIILAGRRGLQVADIEAANLQADLVTLSACQSGLNDVFSSSEPVGLTEVFLRAGASSVLGTMWSVSDESTGELMINFYRRLYDHTGHKVYSKVKSLQEAVINMRAKKQHPYYWAPFVLHGHWK